MKLIDANNDMVTIEFTGSEFLDLVAMATGVRECYTSIDSAILNLERDKVRAIDNGLGAMLMSIVGRI